MKPHYGTTWDELELTPRHTSWQMLRALRHDPPRQAADDPARRAMFSAALEQSEQFFRAAEASDVDTRPLLLFYGLSQSGRALRAAADPEDRWARAGGHGLRVDGETVDGQLSSTLVADQGKGLFRDVARTLNRASLPVAQSVGALTRLGRLGSRFALPGYEPDYGPLVLTTDGLGPLDLARTNLRAELSVPAGLWARELPEVGVRTTSDYNAYKEHVRARLAHYPTLSEARLVERGLGHFDLGGVGANRTVPLEWPTRPHPGVDEVDVALAPFGDGDGRDVTVYPSVPGSDLAAHPYLLWWAVLYVMSHFVRYEPTRWAQIIDIDRSAEGAAVEYLCRQALDVLPELIHRTLTRPMPSADQ
ncbi:MAG: hypothetical protein BGO38_08860 [Cellulomonas sp. 73-145]|uniref:YaaC family protein n=1 Tax=Cellulomonas sp. 73-145 TaxID=1895739 RepID=UPI0009276EFC|nr:YaaC family protein [Cellulomonas sp. 73-145]OJV58278.1 MAG: hypothetical protein BGO38_08860 [Cellulomonas sp. 73-145]